MNLCYGWFFLISQAAITGQFEVFVQRTWLLLAAWKCLDRRSHLCDPKEPKDGASPKEPGSLMIFAMLNMAIGTLVLFRTPKRFGEG